MSKFPSKPTQSKFEAYNELFALRNYHTITIEEFYYLESRCSKQK